MKFVAEAGGGPFAPHNEYLDLKAEKEDYKKNHLHWKLRGVIGEVNDMKKYIIAVICSIYAA